MEAGSEPSAAVLSELALPELDDLPAAMVGNAGIVIARDPGPARPGGQRGQQVARLAGQPVAAGAVVEAVAEAPDFRRVRCRDDRGQIGQSRDAVIRRQHLPAFGEPARFLEMQVGDQQGAPGGPEERALRHRRQVMTRERKANHAPL